MNTVRLKLYKMEVPVQFLFKLQKVNFHINSSDVTQETAVQCLIIIIMEVRKAFTKMRFLT